MDLPLQPVSLEIWRQKYQLKDEAQKPIDKDIDDTFKRVAKALASVEKDSQYWEKEFYEAQKNGATPAGRITSNAGAGEHKPAVSLINCTVSEIVGDSMPQILEANKNAGITLAAGCGIGYEFSTLRPSGAFVAGAGAYTSGSLSFMDIFDKMCFTVSSAGGRRGAQMATFASWHPDIESFVKAKREDGRLRQFNMSILIDDDFIEAVKNDDDWCLFFPLSKKEQSLVEKLGYETAYKKTGWDLDYCDSQGYAREGELILCRIYKTIKAKDLWESIMRSTYDFAEPGFLLVDQINNYNNNYFCENIRATNPCGEQPLPPNGACLLGSINVAKFVIDPFTDIARFDWESYAKTVRVFTRMLDNVVEMNGLPLKEQQDEINRKRRHGMGFLGLGSAMSMLGVAYGSKESLELTNEVSKVLALEGYKEGVSLAKEKGEAPVMKESFNGVSGRELWCESKYMARVFDACEGLKEDALKYGCRFTHHVSIAPTGTISLSINNNVSNGIEPSFAHTYTRNVIQPGKKSKSAETVYSYEMLAYKHITGSDEVPEFFSVTDNVSPKAHVDIQSAAQYWCDSSISKTINVPTDINFDDFQDVYMYAHEKGLKGCTTFRFNPEAFQGVLVKEDDLKETDYTFTLETGEQITAKGNDIVMYEGEEHSAANLYDAIKEGYYGKF